MRAISAGETAGFDPGDTARIRDDPHLLERFYLAHYDEVLRYLARRLDDPHDVADLVAETFLTAIDGAGSFDHRRGRVTPWLIGIAHNHLRHFFRKRANGRAALGREVGRRLLDDDDIAELVERIDAEAAGARARGLLSRLTAAQRELIELVDIHGLTPAEVARMVGIPAGLARIRLHRARKALRQAFHSGE